MNRRDFIKLSGLAGGGLMATAMIQGSGLYGVETTVQTLDPCVLLHSNGDVVIKIYKQEMGQGAATGVAMIAAEEMEADWSRVSLELLDFDKNSPGLGGEYGRFDTGGSFSIEAEWEPMRKVGATVRELIRQAAAKKWGVSLEEVALKNGEAKNLLTNKTLGFGKLAAAASKLPIPERVEFKKAEDYSIIGQSYPAAKAKKISSGELEYSSDLFIPEMVYAMIVRPPVVGGKLIGFDDKAARSVPGLLDIFKLEALERNKTFCKGIKGGVAVIGNSTWACMKARDMLQVQWDHGSNAKRNSESFLKELDGVTDSEKRTRWVAGNFAKGLEESKTTVKAEYETPYLPHLLMESLNSIAHYKTNGELEIWAGTQSPHYSSSNISEAMGIEKSQITLHPYHMGGGFGRRYFTDFILEAVVLSKKIGKPVKLQWTREDEIQHGGYHPLRKDYFEAGLDEDGNIHAVNWDAVSSHEWGGVEKPFFYGHKHFLGRSKFFDKKLLPWGSWRSVTKHSDIFPREIFIDELAHAAGKDPLQFRIDQLKQAFPDQYKIPDEQRWNGVKAQFPILRRIHTKLFEMARDLSGWDRPREKGFGLGIATESYHERSFCTQVVEVDMRGGKLKVTKVYCVIDCGLQINPSLVQTQVESSVLWALNPVLKGGVQAIDGRVQQSNFHDTPLIMHHECPEIIIQSVNLEDRGPQGVGEFAVPAIAPAVSNAVFAATGKRYRTLDLSHLT